MKHLPHYPVLDNHPKVLDVIMSPLRIRLVLDEQGSSNVCTMFEEGLALAILTFRVRKGTLVEPKGNFPAGLAFDEREKFIRDRMVLGL